MQPLALLLNALLFVQASTWQRQTFGEVSLLVPVKLDPLVKNGNVQNSPKGLNSWAASRNKVLYSVALIPHAQLRDLKSRRKAMEELQRNILNQASAKLAGSRTLVVAGRTALDFDYESANGMRARHRLIALTSKLVDLGVTWIKPAAPNAAEVNRFFTSFAIVHKSKK